MTPASPKMRNYFLIGAILSVAVLFGYYLLVFIPQKEDAMRNRGIRVMQRMVNNLHEKEAHYQKSIDNFECQYILKEALDEPETTYVIDNLIYSRCFWENVTDEGDEEEFYNLDFNEISSYKDILELQDAWFIKKGFLERTRKVTQNLDPSIEFANSISIEDFVIWKRFEKIDREYRNEEGLPPVGIGIKTLNFTKSIKRFEYFSDIFLTNPDSGVVLDESKYGIKYFDQKLLKPEAELGQENAPEYALTKFPGVKIAPIEISKTPFITYSLNVEIQGKNYVLTGIIEKDKYDSAIRSVNIWVVMLLVILLVILVLILPVVKPFLIGPFEQLKGADLLWSSVALVFGMAALNAFVLSIDTFTVEEVDLVDRKLRQMGNEIQTDFQNESRRALSFLEKYEKGIFNADTIKNQKSLKEDQAFFHPAKEIVSFLGIQENGKTYEYFDVKKDSIGLAIEANDNLDLAFRPYYRIHATEDSLKVWHRNDSSFNRKYFVSSIFSISSGDYETVVSIEKDRIKDSVLAIVYPFQSINNRYLSPNYSFAIIDKFGDVQYHSDQKKIHNENFFEECNGREELLSYVRNGADTSLSVNYALRDYRMHIQPVAQTDWHLVTMYRIKDSRLAITNTLAMVFMLIVFILIYFVVLHFLLRIQRRNEAKYRNRPFLYWFLNPLNTAPAIYERLFFVNLMVLVFFVVVYKMTAFSIIHVFSLFFSIITLLILYNFRVLQQNPRIDLNKNNKPENIAPAPFAFIEWILLISGIGWTFLHVFFLAEQPHEGIYLVFNIAMLILIFWERFSPITISRVGLTCLKPQMYRAFYMHAFTWVLIVSVVPALLFFKPVYNTQNVMRTADNLLTEYHQRLERNYWVSDSVELAAHELNRKGQEKDISYLLMEIINPFFEEDGSRLKGQRSIENNVARIFVEDTTIAIGNTTSDAFSVSIKPESAYAFEGKIEPKKILSFSLPRIWNTTLIGEAILFWLLVVMFLAMLYVYIRQMSERFFHMELTRTLQVAQPECFVDNDNLGEKENCEMPVWYFTLIGRKIMSWLEQKFGKIKFLAVAENSMMENETINEENSEETYEKNLFLVGVPASGRKTAALDSISPELKSKKDDERLKTVMFIDFAVDLSTELKKGVWETPQVLDENNQPNGEQKHIIVFNFNERSDDDEHQENKLKLLESILGERNKAQANSFLVIVSSLDLYQILEKYHNKINTLHKAKADSATIEKYEKMANRWEAALYNFTKQSVALKHGAHGDFVDRELSFGSTLPKLKNRARIYYRNLRDMDCELTEKERKDKFIEAVADMAENYYFSLWRSCSREEKILLLDLAQDGVLNARNERAIYTLLRKGLVILRPQLSFFNESFKQFVLTSIMPTEVREIELLTKKQGNFKTYQYLVIFLVIVIVTFLSLAEEKAVAQITGLVTLSAALFPSIIKIMGALGNRTGQIFSK